MGEVFCPGGGGAGGGGPRRIVDEAKGFAVLVLRLLEAPAVGRVVELGQARGPVGPAPGPGLRRAVECERVVGPRPIVADVLPQRRVVRIHRLRPVLGYPGDGAACGIDRAAEVVDLAVDAQAPVVVVVPVEQALAVVGAYEAQVRAAADEQLIAVLDDQVSGVAVDEHLLAGAALGGLPEGSSRAQHVQRTAEKSETAS